MTTHTTEQTYDEDLNAAFAKMETMLDMSAYDGNQRNWAQDALNNEWVEGISIDEWVKRALTRCGTNVRML